MKLTNPIPVTISPDLHILFIGVQLKDDSKEMAFDYRIIDTGKPLPFDYQEQIKKFLCKRMDEFLTHFKEGE